MSEKRSNDSQNPTSDFLSLLIKEPKKKNLRRNFVTIDPEQIDILDLKKGDIVELLGKKKTAGIVKASGRKDRGLGIIRIHSKFRKNMGREVDETVEIRKAEVKLAKKVVLLPYGQNRMSINNMENNEEIIEIIKHQLEDNYPITIFDKIYISTNVLLGFIVDNYLVASLIPDDVCIVDKYTDIIFMDDSAEDDYIKDYNLFKKALEFDSHDKNIWLSLGNIYRLQKNYEKAEEAYNNVIELDPKNYWAWMTLGLIYNQKESYDQALNAFQNALKHYPVSLEKTPIPLMVGKHRSLIRNLGFTYKRMGEFDKAIQTFKNILDKYPKSKNIWNELGKIYLRKREYNKAIKTFKMALRINSNEVYSPESHISELTKILLPNTKLSPKFLLMKKRHQKRFLQDNQYSLYYLAKAFKAIGNLDEALKSCKECLEFVNPNFEKALKLQSELLVNRNHKTTSTGENENGVKYCIKCGKPNEIGNKFCQECGTKLPF